MASEVDSPFVSTSRGYKTSRNKEHEYWADRPLEQVSSGSVHGEGLTDSSSSFKYERSTFEQREQHHRGQMLRKEGRDGVGKEEKGRERGKGRRKRGERGWQAREGKISHQNVRS